MNKKKVQTFGEQLTRLLSRHCDEPMMDRIDVILSKIRESERELLSVDKKDEGLENGQHLIEESYLSQIVAECQRLLPKKEYISVLTGIASICVDFGEFATAEALFSSAVDEAKEGTRFANQAAEALQKRADVLLRQARWEPAKSDMKESRRLFSRAKNPVGIGKIENSSGIFMAQQGKTKESVSHFKKAASMFEKAKQTDLASTAHMNLGIVATIRGKFDEALVAYKRALTEFENIGDVLKLAELHHNLGMLFLARTELDSALGQFDESLNYANQAHYDELIGLASLGKAEVYARKKDYQLAQLFGNKALAVFRKLNAHLSIADSYKVKGIIQRGMKHYDVAEVYLHTSVSLNEGYNNPRNLGETYMEIGLLSKESGDTGRAKQVFQKSLKYFKQVGAKHSIDQVKEQLHSLRN